MDLVFISRSAIEISQAWAKKHICAHCHRLADNALGPFLAFKVFHLHALKSHFQLDLW
jgi:hypothetical protein